MVTDDDCQQDQTGQTLVEYALIITLIAIAVVVAMLALGSQLSLVFRSIAGSLALP